MGRLRVEMVWVPGWLTVVRRTWPIKWARPLVLLDALFTVGVIAFAFAGLVHIVWGQLPGFEDLANWDRFWIVYIVAYASTIGITRCLAMKRSD